MERFRHVPDTELLHKSKDEPLQRLEVFTGTGRRRAWSMEHGAKGADCCREHKPPGSVALMAAT